VAGFPVRSGGSERLLGFERIRELQMDSPSEKHWGFSGHGVTVSPRSVNSSMSSEGSRLNTPETTCSP
jgi:hypothetical protein